jgi:hypothetical protein
MPENTNLHYASSTGAHIPPPHYDAQQPVYSTQQQYSQQPQQAQQQQQQQSGQQQVLLPPGQVLVNGVVVANPDPMPTFNICGKPYPRNKVISVGFGIVAIIIIIIVFSTRTWRGSTGLTKYTSTSGICSLSMPAFTASDPGCVSQSSLYTPYYNVNFSSDLGITWTGNLSSVIKVRDVYWYTESYASGTFSRSAYNACYKSYTSAMSCGQCLSNAKATWTPAFGNAIPIKNASTIGAQINGQTNVSCTYYTSISGNYFSLY